ncbi:pilin [Photobacterium sp. S4TG1]|uniref:pilin n=1 Tax=Photobacterium TaxID=657 RepID=UPI000D151CD1|nr:MULTISPECIES: pilin [Photobacterium]MEC6797834.1 pilin [Photobacterium sp. S4TG1]PSW43101.1 pilin [Photobacterium phosphoreum]
MKKQQGFTLIELMIVVAVIGVLSAIAVPKYQEYVKKGALGAALASVTAHKTNVEDSIATVGTFPSVSAAFGIGNIKAASSATAAGSIIATIDEGAAKNEKITLSRDTDGLWTCANSYTAIKISGCQD